MNARTAIVAAVCGLLMTSATGQTGDTRLVSRQGSLSGGVFNFIDAPGNTGYNFGAFQSFCLELDEFITIPQTYTATVNTQALGGGLNVPDNSGDPLGASTQLLYATFVNGGLGLAGSDYTDLGQDDRNGAVQLAIWNLEGEVNAQFRRVDNNNLIGNSEIRDGAQSLLDAITAGAFSAYLGDAAKVRVLNLTRSGVSHQDMLYMIPLPQSAALAGLGVAAVAIRRRR